MISQTLGNRVLDRPLLPNGPIVQLGTFEDILNYGTSSKDLTIMFTLNYKSEFSGICHTEEDFLSAAFEGSKADEITVCVKFSSLTKNLSNLANLNIIIERISLQVSPSIGVSVNQKTYDDFEMPVSPVMLCNPRKKRAEKVLKPTLRSRRPKPRAQSRERDGYQEYRRVVVPAVL